jgi:RNA polymerase sigma-70 factor, ECF subfamily
MAERETELVSLMASGDSRAFEELYNTHARKVFAYLRCKNLDEQTAADVLQETFIAAWRGAARFQGNARLLTWLIGIARHKLADAIRLKERTRAAPLESVEHGDDPLEGHAARLSLREAVTRLDEGQQELLHMVFTLGMSYTEAAQVLEIPEGTVKSRMYSIRKLLAGQLKQEVS